MTWTIPEHKLDKALAAYRKQEMCIRDRYNTLWAQASQYALEYLKDDELRYYYDVTD